jgi:flagellar M-ring protein FliF
MDQLKQLVARFTLRQRITIGLCAVLVLTGLVLFARWNKERDFKPLFSNLPAEDAGLVINRIRESGVEYRLSENGTAILAPSSRVAELRLQLASAGLPKAGRIGFELFDKTNFGATDFTEQINYHRALEGELERSIMSLGEVEQARVHITFPKDSIYAESRQPAKASVMVKLKLAAKLSNQNVLAICHLAASAVEGLSPESISVLDMNGNLLSRPKKQGLPDDAEPNEAILEYRHKIEREIAAKINSTLEPLLGVDKYRAGVTVECDFTSGEQSEETFDPSKSVMVTSQRTEDGSTGLASSGVPGTASNLPRPTSRPSTSSAGTNRRTENITYQSSRLVKRVKLPQGGIKRMSISVLLDHTPRFDGGKTTLDPPSPEKIKVVRDLVAGAAGAQADRGDQVIVESFPFEATLKLQPPPPAGGHPTPGQKQILESPNWMPVWVQDLMKNKAFPMLAGVGGALILVLIGAVVWIIGRSSKKKAAAKMAAALAPAGGSKQIGAGETAAGESEAKIAEQSALREQQAKEVLGSLKLPPIKTKKTEALVKHISAEAKKDPAVLAQVVRTWLNTPDFEH